jgi:hypothetical protein
MVSIVSSESIGHGGPNASGCIEPFGCAGVTLWWDKGLSFIHAHTAQGGGASDAKILGFNLSGHRTDLPVNLVLGQHEKDRTISEHALSARHASRFMTHERLKAASPPDWEARSACVN